MKKFVSILTVVAMVMALCTSAFAAGSPTNPLEPGQIVEPDPGDYNVPDPDATNPSQPTGTTDGQGGGGADTTGDTTGGGSGDTTTPPSTPGTTDGGGTTGGGNAGGGSTGGSSGSSDASQASPTAKLDDYQKASLAYIMTKMLLDTTKVVTDDELTAAMELKAEDVPFPYTIASNPLALKDAKGVRIKKLDNGKLQVTVGQNQVTDGKDPKDLFVIVAPSEVGAKAEVCEMKLDEAGNLMFETSILDGVFDINLKKEEKEENA